MQALHKIGVTLEKSGGDLPGMFFMKFVVQFINLLSGLV
jgi:hypothetical protein